MRVMTPEPSGAACLLMMGSLRFPADFPKEVRGKTRIVYAALPTGMAVR